MGEKVAQVSTQILLLIQIWLLISILKNNGKYVGKK